MKRRRRMEEELERDIAEHLAMETEDNVARGMSPADARNAALRKFGNVALVQEDTRNVWRLVALDTWLADIRHACRRIAKSRGAAALMILSLALAFAPSITVFSVMDRIFLASAPVEAPQEVVEIGFRDTRPDASQPYQSVSYPEFEDFRGSLRSLSGLTYEAKHAAAVVVNGRRTLVVVNLVNDEYFRVLGVPIQLGPGFLAGRPSVIISHSFWLREFAGRSDVVGQTLLVMGGAMMVGGVAGPAFRGMNPILAPDLWIPVEYWADFPHMQRREFREGLVRARLRPSASLSQTAAEVESVSRRLSEDWPASNRNLKGFVYFSLADRARGGVVMTGIGVLLLGILLAVASANVTGILLARAEERRRETAIRQALGASRGRLVRESMVESAVLSMLACGIGLAAAAALTPLLPRLLPSMIIPIQLDFSFGPRVWLYALGMVIVSAVAFGLVPAWRGSRPDLLSGLRNDSAIQLLRVRVPVRSLLIVVQVAAAELVLFGAGLALDTTSALRRVDPGFEPQRPVALIATIPTAADGSPLRIDCEAIRDRLLRLGGVRSVAYGRSVPLAGMGGGTLKLEIPGQGAREIAGGSAGPGFFSALGTPILRGRDLQAGDDNAVLVNATLARQLDPSGGAVGREIRLDGAPRRIVGIFPDTKWQSIYERPRPRAIALTPAHAGGDVTFAVQVDSNPGAYLAALRREIAAALPGSSGGTVKTLQQHYLDSLFFERLATRTLYALGLIALVLTVTGLHGIAAALFARRSKEFAIRLALGAAPGQIMRTVLSSGVKLAAIGLVVGLTAAIPVGIFLSSRIYGLSAWSVPAVGFSSAIVLVAAVLAAAHPARRVLRIQPGAVIQAE